MTDKGIDDDEFEDRVDSWQRRFEGIAQDMMSTPNAEGHYPKIDFGPLVLEFQKIVTGMRNGRNKERSLVVVPGSVTPGKINGNPQIILGK